MSLIRDRCRATAALAPPLQSLRAASLTPRAAKRRRLAPQLSAHRCHTTDTTSNVKPYYVTTPIFYVNAAPHVGHLHSLLLTDVLARYSRLREPDRPVLFSTGTDEHGMKIQQVAKREGKDPKALCDEISERFRSLAAAANSSHTNFIRTTDPEHAIAVHALWNRIAQAGHIYKGSHSGWYAVSDECFYTESQVEDRRNEKTGVIEKVSVETGSAVEWTEEENYKFKLSEFRQPLIDWLEAEPPAVHPPAMRASLLQQLRSQPLADLSISRPRSRLQWGLPVPQDNEHTIYVWVDALTNYLTVAGYPWKDGTGLAEGWPANAHVVGKDIVRFHAIYWPALLMAASLPPPKQVIAHAHWTMQRAKMSKSRGNVADPFEAIDRYGVDVVRWYLMRVGGTLSVDADYSPTELGSHQKMLASQMGNLVSRISSPKLQSRFIEAVERNDVEDAVRDHVGAAQLVLKLRQARAAFNRRLNALEITKALEEAMDPVVEANKLLTQLEPWKKTTAPADLGCGMAYAHEALRVAAILLQPIMPSKMAELLDMLGVKQGARDWEAAEWTSMEPADVAERMQTAGKASGPLFPL